MHRRKGIEISTCRRSKTLPLSLTFKTGPSFQREKDSLVLAFVTCSWDYKFVSVVQPLRLAVNLNETLMYAVNSDSNPVSDLRFIFQ